MKTNVVRMEQPTPSTILARVQKIFSTKAAASEDLESALSDAQNAAADAGAEVDRLAASRRDLLLHGDDAAIKLHDEQAAAAARTRDRAAALAEELTGRIEAARHHQEQTQRQLLRQQAEQASEALRRMPERLAPLYAGLRDVLKEIAEAQILVAKSNALLPDAMAPLPDPERAARAIPSLDKEVVTEDHIELWAHAGDPRTPFSADLQKKVRENDGARGLGVLPAEPGKRQHPFDAVRAQFVKVVTRPYVRGETPDRLAEVLNLPAWKANDHPGWAPRPLPPEDVLKRLSEPAAPHVARTITREPETEFVPADIWKRRKAQEDHPT